ncbi:MAG: IS200/IS605 family transposase [Candidatus Thermoplasmatota archaeon]|nr:IS200/IS605 family transposase [Candidatus Thermoplasmatota archaeon]
MDYISGSSAEIRHHSSSVGRNVLHMSFKAKYCHEVFNDVQVEKRCEEIFRKVSEEHRWILREIGFDMDHVHITIDAGTKGPEDVAKALKGTSGRKLLKEFPYLKKEYFWGSGLWSPAIYFDSLGERTIVEMDDYTRNQGMPKKYSFKPGQSRLDDFAS